MPTVSGHRWTASEANAWWARQDWICGVNFLPSKAVNFLEMWMQETFDRDTIARELRWASEVGFNALRVNLQFLVWKHDRDGLIERMTWFFETASSLGMTTMPVLFDDCGFGGSKPSYGPQPQPVDKIHNSRAVAPPGRAAVMERADWPDYRRYVQDIIFVFKDDSRVLLWDLYNEPGNLMIFTATCVD